MPPVSEEEMDKLLETLLKEAEGDIDCSEMPEMTEDDWARAVRVHDYPSLKEANREASHLAELQRAGMSNEDLIAYKESRIKRPTGA